MSVGVAHADDIIVVVGPTSTLTKEQISDVFLGKNTSDLPVNLPESTPIRAAFFVKATGQETSH